MSYFSRLTDIVTCSLTRLLDDAADPKEAIERIVREMEEGLAGAKRSVATATASEERVKQELAERRQLVEHWLSQAKQELTAGNENQARLALIRKREVEDLIAGLEQQLKAAAATREHLTTMQRALDARLSEARRRQRDLAAGISPGLTQTASSNGSEESLSTIDDSRLEQVDAELEALKRNLDR